MSNSQIILDFENILYLREKNIENECFAFLFVLSVIVFRNIDRRIVIAMQNGTFMRLLCLHKL